VVGANTHPLKALIVVDQLPFDALADFHRQFAFVAGAQPLRLGYVPRTTPVGHATLSTGTLPVTHGVQGRVWYRSHGSALQPHDINDLPLGNFDKTHAASLQAASIVQALRTAAPDASIVVAAAKAFLPFLFGAEASDVAVYPTDVRPKDIGRGDERIVVLVRPFTQRGIVAVQSEAPSLLQNMVNLVAGVDPTTRVEWNRDGDTFELHWVFPGKNNLGRWRSIVEAHGPTIDRFYGESALRLLDALGGTTRYFLQSWFSTDMRGHFNGRAHPLYADAVARALTFVADVANRGYAVVATSDHGGRTTPRHLRFVGGVAEDGSGVRIPLRPASHVVLSGDHLVGYDANVTAPMYLEYWDGTRLTKAIARPRLIADSFAPGQCPAWMLLPRIDEKYSDRGGGGGGDHGACVDGGVVSDIDDEVPLLLVGTHPPKGWPNRLHEVKAWFLSL
jgi:hypothetical protein